MMLYLVIFYLSNIKHKNFTRLNQHKLLSCKTNQNMQSINIPLYKTFMSTY